MKVKSDQNKGSTNAPGAGNPGVPTKIAPRVAQLDPWQAPLRKLPVSLAYAAVVDVRNAESEITEKMVMEACHDIETMQQFPFAPKKSVQAS